MTGRAVRVEPSTDRQGKRTYALTLTESGQCVSAFYVSTIADAQKVRAVWIDRGEIWRPAKQTQPGAKGTER